MFEYKLWFVFWTVNV